MTEQQVLLRRVTCGCRPWWQRWEVVRRTRAVAGHGNAVHTISFRTEELLGYSLTKLGGTFKGRVAQRH